MDKVLAELRRYDSPTICNALERMNIRPLEQGFLSPGNTCQTKGGPFIGFASTAKYATAEPSTQSLSNSEYYSHILATPRPSITVIEDIDAPSCGAIWGEVMAHSHATLGSIALVTNGLVRDVDALAEISFGCFAAGMSPSRAYAHLVEHGTPVTIGNLCIHPGDILFCDKNGIVNIPKEALADIIEACEKIIWAEEDILEYCKRHLAEGLEADLDKLMEHTVELAKRRKV